MQGGSKTLPQLELSRTWIEIITHTQTLEVNLPHPLSIHKFTADVDIIYETRYEL